MLTQAGQETLELLLLATSTDAQRAIGFGGGPVNGYQDDDGLYHFAVGASYPVARQKSVFVQGEFRYGRLGESSYSQGSVGIGIGFSK